MILIYLQDIIPEPTGKIAHGLNLVAVILIPIVVINLKGSSFSLMGSSSICFLYCIVFTKLLSYVQVNLWCRTVQKGQKVSISGKRRDSFSIAEFERKQQRNSNADQDEGLQMRNGGVKDHEPLKLVEYPDNLDLRDLLYFLCAPTLCYELNFPKTTRIRKRFLIKRILEVVVGVNIAMALFQQWMVPSVQNSLIPFSNMEFTKATERLLKLAVSILNYFYYDFIFMLDISTDSKPFYMAMYVLFDVPFPAQFNRRNSSFC